MSKKDNLRPFVAHGFRVGGHSGNQAYGYCPFSEKENKMYVNVKTQKWDSKTEGISGDLFRFLEYVFARIYKRNITKKDLRLLAKDRDLPVEALENAEIGKRGNYYVVPTYSEKGRIRDLRMYKFKNKSRATAGCSVGIWGVKKLLSNSDPKIPVFICEGEWDGIAMDWLLKKNKYKAIVVAVPGSGIFKDEWATCFENRNCITVYDRDESGESGEHVVLRKLGGKARSIKFLHWSDKLPVGFDLRDYVSMEAVKNKRPRRCLNRMLQMIKNHPRKKVEKISDDDELGMEELPERDKSINWNKLEATIKKWLKIEDLDPVRVAVATVLSNFLSGDPIWMFLVASPGGGKSELLGMFRSSPDVYTTSSLTPNSLISGAPSYKGKEPSLLPKIDGKTLCIKDFSTIQTMRDSERESLLGILRDAYDGSAGKVFGTGETKKFDSKFSILAGVTPSVYELDYQFSALGERFLKMFIGEYLDHRDQIQVIERAMDNVAKEDDMREEFSKNMYNFIENTKDYLENNKRKGKKTKLRTETEKRIAYLAAWCSRIKGTVNREKYDKDIITNKAYSEVGTRTGKQLKRLLLCFPTVIYRRRDDEKDYQIIQRVALDSVSAKREDIFRAIFLSCKRRDDTVELKDIIHKTKYSYSTAQRTTDDLIALGAVDRIGHRRPYQYRITDTMHEYTTKSGLYGQKYTQDRPFRSRFFAKVRRKKDEDD